MPRAFFSTAFVAPVLLFSSVLAAAESLRVATFEVDATPPLGSPMAYDPLKEVVMPLTCRGIVLLDDEGPIVLCAVDWIGIGNGGNQVFRAELAKAVGTTPERVAVHTLHQHDAPSLDFSVEAILAENGLSGRLFNVTHARQVIQDAAAAAAEAVSRARSVTHIGLGSAEVVEVASNRRILGEDGKVAWMRFTSGAQEQRNRKAPVGTIDPILKLIAFYHDSEPIVALTYYATHPQSYYRTGGANPDFPGIARQMRQQATGVFHVHFTGAGGNVGAGKWNDGSPPYRQILADRLAAAMQRAWEGIQRRDQHRPSRLDRCPRRVSRWPNTWSWKNCRNGWPTRKPSRAQGGGGLRPRVGQPLCGGGDDRPAMFALGASTDSPHAGRTVCGIPTRCPTDASGAVRRHGRLRRRCSRLHRNGRRLLAGWIRDQPRGQQCRTGGRRSPDRCAAQAAAGVEIIESRRCDVQFRQTCSSPFTAVPQSRLGVLQYCICKSSFIRPIAPV